MFADLVPNLVATVKEAQGVIEDEFGLKASFHPHIGTAVQFESQIDRLLAETSGAAPADATFDLGSLGLFAGLATDDLAVLAGAAERVTYPAGAVILREGDAADRVFLLLKGSVSARLDLGDGRSKRLATMDAGVTFGEMALLSGSARSADLIAETPVDCAVIGLAAIAELAATRPALHATLLANLGRLLAERLNRANREIRMLEP